MSKIQIWKRITTVLLILYFKTKLYLICQRYKFESESQLLVDPNQVNDAVFNMSKIQIWKRITTGLQGKNTVEKLYLICQRYKFESESQLIYVEGGNSPAVFNMSKIQIWKRITTYTVKGLFRILLYLICQRYKFESESQQNCLISSFMLGCI